MNRLMIAFMGVLVLFVCTIQGQTTMEETKAFTIINSTDTAISFILSSTNTSYFFVTSPPSVYAVPINTIENSTNTEANSDRIPLGDDPNSETVSTGFLIDETSTSDEKLHGIYLAASNSFWKVDPSTLTVQLSVGTNEDVKGGVFSWQARTSFFDIDTKKAYVPSYGRNTVLYQFALDDLKANTTKVLNLNNAYEIIGSIYDKNQSLAYFFSSDGTVAVVDLAAFTHLGNFLIGSGFTDQSEVTYVVGEITATRKFAYATTKSANNVHSLNIIDLSNAKNLTGSSATPILSQELGSSGQELRGIALDLVNGQAFMGVFDTGYGSVLRYDLLRRTTIEINEGTGDLSPPVDFLVDITARMVYMVTEVDIITFSYPVTCPNECSGQGDCNYGVCNCTADFIGEDCSEPACDSDCGEPAGRGKCSFGTCLCSPEWTGDNCDIRRCPNDCSRNGDCGGSANNYTCTCTMRWTGVDCGTPRSLDCGEITTQKECVSRKKECGWCQTDETCYPGNNIGPVNGTCVDWYTDIPKDYGIMAFAIIYIILALILMLINIISAAVIDHQNAVEMSETKRLSSATVRRNWWRDERSNMAWKCFEQLQFISYYAFISVGYPTRIISFMRYFNWANFVLPLPNYEDDGYHPERSTRTAGRSILNYEQFANSNDSGGEQIFYAQLVWFAIALAGFVILYLIYALIMMLIKGFDTKEIYLSRLVHIVMRVLNVCYLPMILIAAHHTRGPYGSTIAGSIVVLVVIGVGIPALSFFLTFKKKKQLFMFGYRLKFGSFFSTFHFKLSSFNMAVLAKKAAIGILIGFMAVGLADKKLAIGQVVGCILVLIIYVIAVLVIRPYLDRTHLIVDVCLSILNAITLGIALTHYKKTSVAGEIIFCLLQVVGLIICIGAFINCWIVMEQVHSIKQLCCGGDPKEGKKEKK